MMSHAILLQGSGTTQKGHAVLLLSTHEHEGINFLIDCAGHYAVRYTAAKAVLQQHQIPSLKTLGSHNIHKFLLNSFLKITGNC